MKQDNVWVRLYLRTGGIAPALVGRESLETIVERLGDIRGQSPITGFPWNQSLAMTFEEASDVVQHVAEDDRPGVERLIAAIGATVPTDATADQRTARLQQIRVDLLSADGDTAAGAVMLVERIHAPAPAGMVRRSLLPTLRAAAAIDLTRPGALTLRTMRDRIGWLAGDGCPDIHDETGAEVSDELRRVTGAILVHGHGATRVDWF